MFQWGLQPRKANRVVAKYPTLAVVTMLPVEGKKASRSFEFNKAAIAALGLTETVKEKGEGIVQTTVVFAFGNSSGSQDMFLMNSTGLAIPPALRLGRTSLKVSDRPTYDAIVDKFGLVETEENEFVLEDSGEAYDGRATFIFRPITEEERATATDSANEALKSTADLFEASAEEEGFSLGSTEEVAPIVEEFPAVPEEDVVAFDDPLLEAAKSDVLPTMNADEAFFG